MTRFCSFDKGGGGHSAILLTFIKLPFVVKIFVFVYFEWWFYTGFTVYSYTLGHVLTEIHSLRM